MADMVRTTNWPVGESHANWTLHEVDLSRRSAPQAYDPSDPKEGTYGLTYIVKASRSDNPSSVAGIRSRLLNSQGMTEDPPYCQGTVTDERYDYDTSLKPWSERDENLLTRKAARMRIAFENGAVMASVLRYTLASLILDPKPGSAMRTFKYGDERLQPSNVHSLCNADPWYMHEVSETTYSSWTRVSQNIKLNHAPVIRMRTVGGDITGMCLERECTKKDYDYFVTWYADIFAADPPLSKHQLAAVNALNDMSTNAFWMQAAHENGVHEDAEVLKMVAHARELRDLIYGHGVRPRYIDTD
jgi:hypothetical protein